MSTKEHVDQERSMKIVEQIAVDQQIFDPMTASRWTLAPYCCDIRRKIRPTKATITWAIVSRFDKISLTGPPCISVLAFQIMLMENIGC